MVPPSNSAGRRRADCGRLRRPADRQGLGRRTTTLHFWNFYAPDGEVKTQVDWWMKMADDWNAQSETKVQLDYIVDYMNGTTLSTSFASGQGPDIFLISPGDFLRYYNGGVLLDLTPLHRRPRRRPTSPKASSPRARSTARSMACPWSSSRWPSTTRSRPSRMPGSTRTTCPRPGTSCSRSANKLTTADRYGVLFETDPGYYQNFTWYPFMWQGGGEFQGADGKSAFDSPGVVAGAEALAGRDQLGRRAAPGQRRRLGHRRQSRCRLLRHAEHGHLGHLGDGEQRARTSPTASSSCRSRPAAST